jgi:MFS family permease
MDSKEQPDTGASSPVDEVPTIKNTASPKDGDAALSFLRANVTDGEAQAVDEKALVRKIDWMLMPLCWGCYFLQYLDKTLINYAAVMGLREDTGISTSQFSTLAMLFYVSYLACELPHGWLMQRFPTAKYLGCCVVLWGVSLACTSACSNYAGLIVTRLLLGAFEAAVAPSLILITTMWYKKQGEQPVRTAIWYLGTGTGIMIGALISFGFQHWASTNPSAPFRSWQVMFLVIGLLTILVGILVILFLPDNPMSCKRLTPAEKLCAIQRLRSNQMGIENKHFKPTQALECLTDPQTWLLCLITICSNVPNGAVSSYQATLIRGFGFSSKTTALLSLPSGAVGCIAVLSASLLAGKYDQRGLNIISLMLPSILGACLMSFLPDTNRAGKLIGVYMINCTLAVLTLLYSWVGANYAGHTKKVTMNAVLLMSFCLGNIIGPLTFQDRDAPAFLPAKVAIIVTCAATVALAVCLRVYYRKVNKHRDGLLEGVSPEEKEEDGDGWLLDRTDKENKEFRYKL